MADYLMPLSQTVALSPEPDNLTFMPDLTQVLEAVRAGDAAAADELLPLVYAELRRLAAAKLAHERPGQTLSATALVHEAYLRLVGSDQQWAGRKHFFLAAAESMRRILIERVRARRRLKRGGDRQRVDLDAVATISKTPTEDLLALDDALQQLAVEHPRKVELVKLRFIQSV